MNTQKSRRHLVAQSFLYKSRLELLAHDFNWGISINWTAQTLKPVMDQMLSFGFNFDESAEAVIVSNKSIDAVE